MVLDKDSSLTVFKKKVFHNVLRISIYTYIELTTRETSVEKGANRYSFLLTKVLFHHWRYRYGFVKFGIYFSSVYNDVSVIITYITTVTAPRMTFLWNIVPSSMINGTVIENENREKKKKETRVLRSLKSNERVYMHSLSVVWHATIHVESILFHTVKRLNK